jgi:hypothetical protein
LPRLLVAPHSQVVADLVDVVSPRPPLWLYIGGAGCWYARCPELGRYATANTFGALVRWISYGMEAEPFDLLAAVTSREYFG